jgi:DNA-binding CsgD family transcriptional regulator
VPTPHGVAQVASTRQDVTALASDGLAVLERSVLQLIVEGHTSDQIAKRLKMNVNLVNALMNYAIRNDLIKR